jgi:hypothetical protein
VFAKEKDLSVVAGEPQRGTDLQLFVVAGAV